jgi:hypothetical protein
VIDEPATASANARAERRDALMGITNGLPPSPRRRSATRASSARGPARRHVDDVGAEEIVQQGVRRQPCRRLTVRDQDRAHAEFRRGRRRRSRVIRLHAARGDQRVGAVGHCARRHERQLSDLVAAEPERDRIVTLDEETRSSAEVPRQIQHRLDHRRRRHEWQRRKTRQHLAQLGSCHRTV